MMEVINSKMVQDSFKLTLKFINFRAAVFFKACPGVNLFPRWCCL
jgi:hypothetical protein